MDERVPKRLRPRGGQGTRTGSKRDLDVLAEIAWAGFLTTGQIERLTFPSRRRAQRRLRALLDAGLLRAHLQGDAMHRDNVWGLTPRGLEFAVERGGVGTGTKLSRPNVRSQKLAHAITIRDVAVGFLVAERRGLLALHDLRLDEELANAPIFRAVGIIPDGLAVIECDGVRRTILWEVATDAQPLAQVRAKIRAITRLLQADFPAFRDAAPIVIVIVETEARRDTLARFVASEFTGLSICVALRAEVDDPDALVQLFAAPGRAESRLPIQSHEVGVQNGGVARGNIA